MPDDVVNARHYATGQFIRLSIREGKIAEVEPPKPYDGYSWVAPAFWDIQCNGRWGISFSDPSLTVDQVFKVVHAQAGLGTARVCPTLITAPREVLRHGVATIAAACEVWPDVAARVLGIHLEGPYISEVDGYRGAHPRESVRDPDWEEFLDLQEAGGGRIAIVTLAPERAGAFDFIRKAVASGVIVALGHTAADGPTIRAAVDAGARLSTHLGNGIAAQLPRHPNPIWHQAAEDRLWASLIADGHHLDADTLRVLIRAKQFERIILVSDASPLAGLPPGRYGDWEVDPSGKIVVAGTPYLAGSNQGLETGINGLLRAGMTRLEAWATVTQTPAFLLRRESPSLAVGEPANLVEFREWPRLTVIRTCVDGEWVEAAPLPGS